VSRVDTEIDGRRLSLSNLDKVLYPETGLTKAGVIDYYRRIAPALLPHLAGRAITRVRYPDGVAREGFFEKHCPDHRPDWVATASVARRSVDEAITFCLVDDLATLVWLANLAALELHAPMARADDPDHPTAVVFDLDPGPPAALGDACRVALTLRQVLEGLDLESWPKTSGGKGLHVYVPIRPGPDHSATREFALAVAEVLARRDPATITQMDRATRAGKVFVDWSQNARHKTTVAPYSLRAAASPSVSTPVTWDEVAGAAGTDDHSTLRFDPASVVARFEGDGDLFAPVLTPAQQLPELGG